MIAFDLRLTARSMRWLGPVLIALIWTSFTFASPGTALGNASNSFMMVVGVAVATRPSRPIGEVEIVAACATLQLAATAIGVGIGSLLHRPVVRHAGATLLVATATLVGLILLPPVQHVLRQLNDDRTGGLVVLGVVALAAGTIAVTAAGALADRHT